ncbi:MAG: orotidine-5'-phosphate decarboxylase [Pirellulaceae bacterium]|nr:orotidine-5'-phosphate decarboxylase [Pirellulaceae bacterium]
MSHFTDQLAAGVLSKGTPVLVGLDPRPDRLPAGLLSPADSQNPIHVANAYEVFCKGIIDVVATHVAVVKPQAAFFEQLGPPGMNALATVIRHATEQGLLVILDGKRNDIGSTAEGYAEAYLGRDHSAWGADALTVSPYLGYDTLEPFLHAAAQHQAGVFVLVKTSNLAGKLQDLITTDGRKVYQHVAAQVQDQAHASRGACGYGLAGAVVGATHAEQIAELRSEMPSSWFLVPGFGSQGGTAADVAAAFDERGLGAIINNSRGIIFAHARKEYASQYGATQWQQAVEAATRDMIDQLRAETPAGQLVTRNSW